MEEGLLPEMLLGPPARERACWSSPVALPPSRTHVGLPLTSSETRLHFPPLRVGPEAEVTAVLLLKITLCLGPSRVSEWRD